jgi:curved DNA-binding protein CbpA
MNNYDILGVSQSATKQEIKKAYHKLSLLHHPDRPNGNHEKFLKIKDAYEALIVFEPNKTHNFYNQEKHHSYIHVFEHYYDKKLKGVYIDLSFSRDFTHFSTPDINFCYHHFYVRGLNQGWILISLDYLIKCDFKFELHCYTNYGKVFIKSFTYKDPRSKWVLFKLRYFKAEFLLKLFLRGIVFLALYILLTNLFK